jgi:hypothetical protein
LTAEQWKWSRTSIPCVGAGLPAMLDRSADETALLVQRHLPHADQAHLHRRALPGSVQQRAAACARQRSRAEQGAAQQAE